MDPATYDAWYASPRGAWIGEAEYALLLGLLALKRGEALLDIGSGTGYFTRCFAQERMGAVVGVDPNVQWVDYARRHAVAEEGYVAGSALALPFADGVFDVSVAVTALCFVDDRKRAVEELLRVTRRRFVLGMLNRHSILYRQKRGGAGAYAGARWDTAGELRALFADKAVRNLTIRSTIFMPGGSRLDRAVEHVIPSVVPWGAFLAVAGDVAHGMLY